MDEYLIIRLGDGERFTHGVATREDALRALAAESDTNEGRFALIQDERVKAEAEAGAVFLAAPGIRWNGR